MTINQNFSPIPQICTPNTTNLTEKNFWKVSQFSRKTYIVCKIWRKMVLLGLLSVTPWFCDNQSKFQSYSTNLHANATIIWQSIKISVLFHKCTAPTLNKEFLENFLFAKWVPDSQFHNSSTFSVWIFYKIICCFLKFHTYCTNIDLHCVPQNLEKNCTNLLGFWKMVFGILKSYPWLFDNQSKFEKWLFLFYKSTHQTVPFWWQKFSRKILFAK